MDYAIGSKKWPGFSKLIEESGELQQVIGKIIALDGNVEHWDGSNLKYRLEEDIGDVQAAISFLLAHNDLSGTRIRERRDTKKMLFEKWHSDQASPTHPFYEAKDSLLCECGEGPDHPVHNHHE